MNNVEVREYQTTEGKAPLTEWLASLRDGGTRARITARLDRLCGGDKNTQAKDIETAHAYWKDYKARLPKPPVHRGGTPSK